MTNKIKRQKITVSLLPMTIIRLDIIQKKLGIKSNGKVIDLFILLYGKEINRTKIKPLKGKIK